MASKQKDGAEQHSGGGGASAKSLLGNGCPAETAPVPIKDYDILTLLADSIIGRKEGRLSGCKSKPSRGVQDLRSAWRSHHARPCLLHCPGSGVSDAPSKCKAWLHREHRRPPAKYISLCSGPSMRQASSTPAVHTWCGPMRPPLSAAPHILMAAHGFLGQTGTGGQP